MSNTEMTRQPRNDDIRAQMAKMEPQFKAVLPAHIPPEKFVRVAMTAIQRNPDLVTADRGSLFEAAMLCAQDGLLPDGKEAVLTVFKTKVKQGDRDVWVKKVQYIPMISGLRKKARQSGEIRDWTARVVHENDHFRVIYGDEERVEHEPVLNNPGNIIAAYSKVVFRDGSRSYEVMTLDQIEAIRSKARSDNVWASHFDEMARKTVMRRHAKYLPLSSDLEAALRRVDALYDFEPRDHGDRASTSRATPIRDSAKRLDAFAAAESRRIEARPSPIGDAGGEGAAAAGDEGAPAATHGDDDAFDDDAGPDWRSLGREAFARGIKITTPPGELRHPDMRDALADWKAGWREAEAAERTNEIRDDR